MSAGCEEGGGRGVQRERVCVASVKIGDASQAGRSAGSLQLPLVDSLVPQRNMPTSLWSN